METPNETGELVILPIYGGEESWRVQHADALFPSNESLRWQLREPAQSELMAQGLIWIRGRRLMTSEPRKLLAAIIGQMQRETRERAAKATVRAQSTTSQ
ncbi:hypothetical protein [Cupriavidus oxalaticus]|uniref:Uncharacterized protein n=1 Tax=Cupriavidus oxalaticus TaxID=96344 RepID=A0A4P7L9N1_9BURK|nr:hypothetical protein [Cupriavidus oxalaticus]QBY52534.1 hypothetical protein E0W60_15195 [Cupriavidus oxalaticus]